ncbi:hypothetical protein Aglo01_34850 [Actinokineospora globicatena]|nr:hypothetical protein Aglo01_34850 [Actinokineospora globicatena]GLW86586.1 hypothetical protein Aglo02_42250 [Actinokineospora globicatena]
MTDVDQRRTDLDPDDPQDPEVRHLAHNPHDPAPPPVDQGRFQRYLAKVSPSNRSNYTRDSSPLYRREGDTTTRGTAMHIVDQQQERRTTPPTDTGETPKP